MSRLGAPRTRPRKQIALALAALALAITAALAATSAMARPAGFAAAQPALRIANTLVGPLLVNQSGRTVYTFARDKPRTDVCRNIKGCEHDWPVVTTVGSPAAGPGVKKSLLGTIPYKGKLREVTYKGHPLHTYRFDTGQGAVINIGIVQYGGAWYALNAEGSVVK